MPGADAAADAGTEARRAEGLGREAEGTAGDPEVAVTGTLARWRTRSLDLPAPRPVWPDLYRVLADIDRVLPEQLGGSGAPPREAELVEP